MENELLKTMHRIDEKAYAAVYVADDVFTTIIGMSATEVDGVYSLADLSTDEAQAKLSLRSFSRCMRLEFNEDRITVTLALTIAYGYNLPEVCAAVQGKVICGISNMIGYTVERVNIKVADVMMR